MSNSKDTIQTGIQNWNSVCESPQTVSVFGIPYNTRFGSILVKADYDMKKLVDGSDSLDIPDFASLLDMKLNRLRTAIMAKEQPVVQISSTNRFWFYPGENHYLEDDGIVVIEKSQVTLLTEEQYVSGSGKMVGTGRPDPMAREFAQNFTTRYSEIAVNRPIYLELENLFRYVALAKIIYIRSGQTELGFDLSYFLDYFEIHFNPVASALPGRHNVKEFLHKQDFGDSTQIFQVWLPCCGGVAIEMNLSQKNFTLDKSGELLNLKQTVLEAKPMPNSLFWDYPIRGRDD